MNADDSERLNLPSASSFYADVACPGRQNILRQLRAQGGSFDEPPADADMKAVSERGTRIHKARKDGNTFALSPDELKAYQDACGIERGVVEAWMGEHNLWKVDPIVEERLWLSDPDTMAPRLSGQLDVIYLAGREALICDWKTNMAYYAGAVSKSWQVRIYALLAWKEWPHLNRIRVAFIKPEAFGPKEDVADVSFDDLRHIQHATESALWRTRQPDAPRVAGRHCLFCPARSACPEAARYAMLPEVPRKDALDDTLALVQTLPPEDLLPVWRKWTEVEKIFEAIEARLKALPPEEHERLGLKLKEGRRLDTIKDKLGAFNALRGLGYSSEEILACAKFGKEAVMAMIQTRGATEDMARAIYENELDPFIERDRSKPSLVELQKW